MNKSARRILLISHETDTKPKLQSDPAPKMAKGFIRLGHDARCISYASVLAQLSPFKSRSINRRFYKERVDEALAGYARSYEPDIVFVGFSRGVDHQTVDTLRAAAPGAVFFSWDGDPWPENNPGRIAAGCALDIVFATNNGRFLDKYRRNGAKSCLFLPNLIDPDIDRSYPADKTWHSNVLWTGKAQHSTGIAEGETDRVTVLKKIQTLPDVKIYGCDGFPKIGGIDYFRAISSARIGISINAVNDVPLYHSDRFTHYSAAGTLVLAKRVPDTELLMKDKEHVCYFDTAAECMELVDWYLAHENVRAKIANAGMAYCQANYNVEKIAGYILDTIDTGEYEAPWGRHIAN
jgi:hypothetical protein